MPLTSLSLTLNQSFALQVTNPAPFQPTRYGTDSIGFNWNTVSLSTVNEQYGNTFTLAASGTQTIALNALTNVVGESLSFTAIYSVIMVATGTASGIKIGPAGSNGFPICGGTNTFTFVPGDCFTLLKNPTGSGLAVTGSTFNLLLTNLDSVNTATVQIVIVGNT
jgi:hypothetical protein